MFTKVALIFAGAMVGLLVLVLIVVVALPEPPGELDRESTPENPYSKLPGEPSVYQKIDTSTDCAELQATFDRANRNFRTRNLAGTPLGKITLSYMDRADERMGEIGCYR